MSEYDEHDTQDDGVGIAIPSSDYEMSFNISLEDSVEFPYEKAEHWVKFGVKPNTIFLENKIMGVINFHKVMKDPLLIQAGIERFIDFRCSITITDANVDVVFSSICYYEPDSEPIYIDAYEPELSSIHESLNTVSQNLFNYLRKPLVRSS